MAETIETIREDAERARLSLEAAEARAALDILEGRRYPIREAWGDYVDPYEFLRDDAAAGWRMLGGVSDLRGDRAGGQDRQIFQTEQELAEIRGWGRALSTKVSPGIGALEALTNYTIGQGYAYHVQPAQAAEPPAGLVEAVQRFVDMFLDRNDWAGDLERELHERSRQDGEFFLALDLEESGHVAARVLEPACVTEPANPRQLEPWVSGRFGIDCEAFASCWRFGVHTKLGDTAKPLGYHVVYDGAGGDWDYLPAGRVEHYRRNVPRNVKRGVSDYYPVREFLLDAEKLLRNTVRGSQVQAAIAYIRKHAAGTTQSQVQSLVGSQRYQQITQQTPAGSRIVSVVKHEPGTVVDTGQQDYHEGPGARNATNFIAVLQAALRFTGIRWCMPEYMISADASNANFASTLVAESPFVKAREHDQQRYKATYGRVLWKALRLAHEAGWFGRFGLEWRELETLLDIQIEAPAVASRDQTAETSRNEVLVRNGVMARRTWATREGLDLDEETEAGAKEACQCQQPGGVPGMPGVAGMQESGCGTGDGGFKPGNDCAGGGGGSATKPAPKKNAGRSGKQPKTGGKPDKAAGRPTKPSERVKGASPPIKPTKPPPKPRGKTGGKAGGFSATGQTNTEIGDMGEAALEQLGMRSILPPGQRQNPLDIEYDHSGYAFEVKTVTTASTEYKLKPKAREVKSKIAYAKKHKLKPASMILVMDAESGVAHAYWRDGIGAYRLPADGSGWNYAGEVRVK